MTREREREREGEGDSVCANFTSHSFGRNFMKLDLGARTIWDLTTDK